MSMWRGTTPTNTFSVNIDLTSATAIYVTYAQKGVTVLEKTGADLDVTADKIVVHLTQAETLSFAPGLVFLQIRYVMPDGSADASDIIITSVDGILKDGVIPSA